MIISDDIRKSITGTVKGSILSIEVSAGSREDRFPAGYNPWRQAVGIHVRAPAIENKANKAIISLIAKTLEIPKSAIHIVSGQTSSGKKILLDGINPDFIADSLSNLTNDS